MAKEKRNGYIPERPRLRLPHEPEICGSPTKTLTKGQAPSSDDIEPLVVPRDDVEIGNDKDEEPLE